MDITRNELERRVLEILPSASFEEDNYGQIVIYTGMKDVLCDDGQHRLVDAPCDEED